MSDKVKLEGLSAKGKQRVKQWGDTWVVLKKTNNVLFSDRLGGWLFVQAISDQKGSSSRWVNLTEDVNFKVVYVD